MVSDATRVQVFLLDGTFVRCLHLQDGANGAFWPAGVAVTSRGEVVVSDHRNHDIFVTPVGA